MKEYIKIQTGESLLVFKDFRIAYGTLMPLDGKFRLDADIATFDGPYNKNQVAELESEFQTQINTKFNKVGIKITNATVNSPNLKDCRIEIQNGGNEEEGLVALNIDWVIYLRNIKIKFEELNGELYIQLNAESEDIDLYATQGINTTYEMVSKLNSVIQVGQFSEIIEEGRKYMNLDKRYTEILTKMQGEKPRDVELNMISELNRPIEYNDSIWAWNQVRKTIEQEQLIDGWNGQPIDNK